MRRKTDVVPTSFSVALLALRDSAPEAVAVADSSGAFTRRELDRLSTQLGSHFRSQGVTLGSIVSLVLPNDRWLICAAVACWKLGATPQPLSTRMPGPELDAILAVTEPSLVVRSLPDPGSWAALPDADLPLVMSPAWKAPVSGGSTGRPKVIVSAQPADIDAMTALAAGVRLGAEDIVLVTAALHHNGPFQFASLALVLGAQVIIVERFDAVNTLQMLQRHEVTWAYFVPTMMSRIAKLPGSITVSADLSRLRTILHMAAPCPGWVKQFWIDRLGPDAVWELYAGTEGLACTLIGGREWLTHPGSVGCVVAGEISVRDTGGTEVPSGTVGELWMRSTSGPTYTYIGSVPRAAHDGWESLGDLGFIDADGYVYLNDRLSDMVLVGGVNVYPAEVEAVLEQHPEVVSAAVVGLPDDDLGNRLLAIVYLAREVSDDELIQWCSAQLSSTKVPRAFDRVGGPLRDDAGKVRRSALRSARLTMAVG